MLFLCDNPLNKMKFLKETVDKIYEQLGYDKFNIVDKEFNRKVYQYVMLTEKVI
jgi:hypothetical protein